MSKIFTKDDYNSGDGMLTSVWGPSMWHTLHTISFNYPVNPTNKQKKYNYIFFNSLRNILPCKYCRDNLKKNLKCNPLNMNTMKNRNSLSLWLYKLHELINKMLGKKSNLTYNDVRDRYENFRSRCLKKNKKEIKKKKIESGCTNPLYGNKSKCILNIVPKNTKCKTFKIDKRCIIRR